MRTYFLPEKLRNKMKKIWGKPIFGTRKEVKREFLEFLEKKKFNKVITVGDCCSLNLPSDVKIFDRKIKRKKIKNNIFYSLTCKNPPATLQKEVWPIIRKAIRENDNVFVDGEEDLLVIPCVLLSKAKTLVVYGFPNKGICLIEVSAKIKEDFKSLLKEFRY